MGLIIWILLMIVTPDNTLRAQYEFATISPKEYKHPAIIGGFGSGKTHSIPLRWMSLIEYRATKQKVKTKLMVVEPTKEMIRDVLSPELDSFFNQFNIYHKYHKTYHNYTIIYKGYPFIAMLRSSDVWESLTGKTVTDIIIDEYDKKHSIDHQVAVWNECLGRIRGADYSTLSVVTTPEGYKNTYNLWGECDYKEKKNFKLIRAKTYENKFLPQDYIENLYDQYSEELVKQYIEAQFINLTQGKVYYAWDREKNNTVVCYSEDYPLKLLVDFNVNPMKWAVCQSIGKADYIIDEIVKSNTYTQQMANEVAGRYGKNTYYQIYGDYTGGYRSTSSPATDFEIIQDILPNSQLYIQPNPLVVDRINAVNSRLCNSKGQRRLFVNIKKCPHLAKDFERVTWDEKKREVDKKTDSDLTHISDAVGYFVHYEYPIKKIVKGIQS